MMELHFRACGVMLSVVKCVQTVFMNVYNGLPFPKDNCALKKNKD